MLGDLPKLFGRAFAIAFLLPAAAIVTTLSVTLHIFGFSASLVRVAQEKDTLGAVLVLLTVWLIAIALLALNVPITRLLAGYGATDPFKVRLRYIRRIYRNLGKDITKHQRTWDEADGRGIQPAPEMLKAYASVRWRMARDFPDEESSLLSTRFGNAMRASEFYPQVVYGIDPTYGWTRLLAVVPADYRQMIEDEKAQMDFWINLWFGSILTGLFYILIAILEKRWPSFWIPIAAAFLALFSAKSARSMAYRFGIVTMSAFDLFRGDLCQRLGLTMPSSFEDERKMWELASQVWVYRSTSTTNRLNGFRIVENQDAQSSKRSSD